MSSIIDRSKLLVQSVINNERLRFAVLDALILILLTIIIGEFIVSNSFPRATFIEWLWTVMNFVGVISSIINAVVIYIRGRRAVNRYNTLSASRAVALLFIQRVIRSNALGIITTLFTIMGILVIIASNDPGEGLALYVGPVFGFSLFAVGLIITGYQLTELLMRPEIDEAIEKAMLLEGEITGEKL